MVGEDGRRKGNLTRAEEEIGGGAGDAGCCGGAGSQRRQSGWRLGPGSLRPRGGRGSGVDGSGGGAPVEGEVDGWKEAVTRSLELPATSAREGRSGG